MNTVLYTVPTGYTEVASTLLLPVFILIIMILFPKSYINPVHYDGRPIKKRSLNAFWTVGIAFVSICIIWILYGQLSMRSAVVGAYTSGEYEIVEGYVENFIPTPSVGNGYEMFDIGGIHFEYSDTNEITGYHNARVNGGVIRGNGQYLRIGYVYYESYGNIIVYIEERTPGSIPNSV